MRICVPCPSAAPARGANLVRCSMLCVGRECVDAARDLVAMVNMLGASRFIFLLHFTRSKFVLTLVTKTTVSRTGSTTLHVYVLQYPERPQGIGGEEEIFRRDYVQIGIVKVDSLERSTQH